MVTSQAWSIVLGKAELLLAFGFYQNYCIMNKEEQLFKRPSEIDDDNVDAMLEIAEKAGFAVLGNERDRKLEAEVIEAIGVDGSAKIFTSYYGNAKVLKRFNIQIIRIAQFAPRYMPAHNAYVALAPSKELLARSKAGTLANEQFELEFNTGMDKLDPIKVVADLLSMGHGKSVAILCYEKPPETCHRQYVREWLEKYNIEITEFPFV